MTERWKRAIWASTCLYVVLLLTVSLLPSGRGVLGGWDWYVTATAQNALHVPAYTGLMLTVCLAAGVGGRLRPALVAWIALGCWVFGLAIEAAQAAIPGRTGSVVDVALNGLGVIAGVGLVAIYLLRSRKEASR